jgi:methyltransferase (TIGR00027 family)
LIQDPYAAPLVRAVGIEFFTKVVDGGFPAPGEDTAKTAAGIGLMTDVMAVRTRFFDDFFVDAGKAGVRQAVILAAGLDSRAYRLPWPAGTVVYEIDQPRVVEAKSGAMAALGAEPTAQRRTVAIDLREDWPSALRDSGFDASAPSAWSAEGLLMYLPPDAQDRLFDSITALSAPGSRLATEFHGGDYGASLAARAKDIAAAWQGSGLDLDFTDLFYAGERSHVVDYLRERGWDVMTRDRADVFTDYGRRLPVDDTAAPPLRNSVAVTAIRTEEHS